MDQFYVTYISNWDESLNLYVGKDEDYAREIRVTEDNARGFYIRGDFNYYLETWENGVCIKTEYLRSRAFNTSTNDAGEEFYMEDYD